MKGTALAVVVVMALTPLLTPSPRRWSPRTAPRTAPGRRQNLGLKARVARPRNQKSRRFVAPGRIVRRFPFPLALQERGRQCGEDIAEPRPQALRLANVKLRRLEARVPGAVHDLERVVAADRTPRDAGR